VKEAKLHRVERRYGLFKRSFSLPEYGEHGERDGDYEETGC